MGFLPRSEAHSSVAAATLTELAAPFRESTLFGMAQVRARHGLSMSNLRKLVNAVFWLLN